MRHLLTVALLLSLATPAIADTLRVPSEYGTINAGLDAAVAGDTVLVAPGTYTEFETRIVDPGNGFLIPISSLAFMKSGVTVKSEAGSQSTTLDLQDSGSGVRCPILCALLTGTTIDGFRITGSGVNHVEIFVQHCDSWS